jgi:phosphate-selective porin
MNALASLLLAMMSLPVEVQSGSRTEQGEIPRELQLQETQEERLRRVEEQLRRQQEKIEEQQRRIEELERSREKKGSSFRASFTDGFHLTDDEGSFDLHVGGRILLHYRYVPDLPHAFSNGPGTPPAYFARTQPDTFYVKTAGVIVDGTIFHEWGYRVTGGVATTTGGPNARLDSTYIEWKRLKELRILAGNFRQPISPETMGSLMFMDEIERSVLAPFVPSFELGLMAYGRLWEDVVSYHASVTNGRSYLASQGRSRNDDDNTKEAIGRLAVAPFARDQDGVLRHLTIGLAGTISRAHQASMQTNFSVASNELAVTWLIPSEEDFFDGRRVRGAADLSWSHGPFSFRMEGLYRSDRVTRPAAGVDERLLTRAWYVQAGCILTGEEKDLDRRLVPLHPLDFREGGIGAVELVARMSAASLERATLMNLGTDLNNQTNRMAGLTVGLNWWPVRNVRVSVDGVREDYYRGIVFMPSGNREKHLYGMLLRFQTDF